ncbi:MAG: SoxR reducing system RseC family protein [Defluviitaleaceae bacterium]|nr:SoxR reducing system RseC family protein [Defluviitaleaceae bacterium]
MGEIGLVVSASKESAVVKLKRSEACAKCKACTAGLMKHEMIINAKNLCNAKEGDYVNIELESSEFLKAVFIMYGIPCVFFISGVLLGYYILPIIGVQGDVELLSFLIGATLMIAAFLLIKRKENRLRKENHMPVATMIVEISQ